MKLQGEAALHNFMDAARFVREGKFDEALSVELMPGDRAIIEKRIQIKREATDSGIGASGKSAGLPTI